MVNKWNVIWCCWLGVCFHLYFESLDVYVYSELKVKRESVIFDKRIKLTYLSIIIKESLSLSMNITCWFCISHGQGSSNKSHQGLNVMLKFLKNHHLIHWQLVLIFSSPNRRSTRYIFSITQKFFWMYRYKWFSATLGFSSWNENMTSSLQSYNCFLWFHLDFEQFRNHFHDQSEQR